MIDTEHHAENASGFTLVETLAVLIVIGLASALVVAYAPTLHGPSVSAQAESVYRLANHAAATAWKIRKPVALVVDISDRRVFIRSEEKVAEQFSSDFQLGLRTGRNLVENSKKGNIIFYPDGGSSGGVITLVNEANKEKSVSVHWLTGRVTLR